MSHIDSHFFAQLKPTLERVELSRLEVLRKRTKWFTILGVTLVIMLLPVLFTGLSIAYSVLVVVTISIGIFIAVLFINAHKKDYKLLYKRTIIDQLTKLLQPEVRYTPTHGVSIQEFRSMDHYGAEIGRYSFEDLFNGKIGQVKIKFSTVHAEREQMFFRGSVEHTLGNGIHYHTIFKGIPILLDFNTLFFGMVTVKTKFVAQNFVSLGRLIKGEDSNLIQLGNPEFDEIFVVHSENSTKINHLLTPDIQEKFLQIRSVFGEEVIFSFRNNSLFITLATSLNLFEPNLNISAFEVKEIQKFAFQMNLIFSLVEGLSSNTLIRTEQ